MSRSSRARSRGCASSARPASRPPSCRAAATARPSWTHAGITNLFDTRVDGETALELGLAGKPAPDMFLEAARRLGVAPERAVVVEDALAGVEAGRAGAFGLVIGVDRDGHAAELAAHGADFVVADLSELLADADGARVHRCRPATSTGCWPRPDGSSPRPETTRRIRGGWWSAPTTPTTSSRPRPCSRCRTASSDIRAPSRRASRRTGRRRCSTASTRPGRSCYPERAYGFATTGQTILPVPDGTTIRLLVDDDPITCETTEVREFERALDMRRGSPRTRRRVPAGGRSAIPRRRHAVRVAGPAPPGRASATRSPHSTSPAASSSPRSSPPARPRPRTRHHDPRRSRALSRRRFRPRSSASTAARRPHVPDDEQRPGRGRRHGPRVRPADGHARPHRMDADRAHVVFDVDGRPGQNRSRSRSGSPTTTATTTPTELADRVELTLDQRPGHRATPLPSPSTTRGRRSFWERSEVVVGGRASQAQQALHFSLFTLLQASLRARVTGYRPRA